MKAYFEGSKNVCPLWSMEKVCYDIFYDVGRFMLNIQFFHQPLGSELCGVCSINNTTQSETVISQASNHENVNIFPICLTQLGITTAETQKNDMPEEDWTAICDETGTKSSNKNSLLHNDKEGTSFVLIEIALKIAVFSSSTLLLRSAENTSLQRLNEMQVSDGWILQSYDKEISEIAHIVSIRKISSSHVLLFDSWDPAPLVYSVSVFADTVTGMEVDGTTQVLCVNGLPLLPWFNAPPEDIPSEEKPDQNNKLNQRVFVFPKSLSSTEFSL